MRREKQRRRVAFIIIGEIIATLISVVVLISLGQTTYSAEYTVDKYVKARLMQEWSTLYDTLVVDDTNEFLSKEAYVTAQTINCMEAKSESVEIVNLERKNQDLKEKQYKVDYIADGVDGSFEVTAVKKGMVWKINDGTKILKQFKLSVPRGAEVTLDKIVLSSKYKKSKTKSTRDVYIVPTVFGATHFVEITGEDFEDTKKLVTMTEEDEMIRVQANYSDDVLQAMARRGMDDLNTILSGASNDKNYISLPILKNMFDKNQKKVAEIFSTTKEKYFKNEDENLKMIDFRMGEYEVRVKPITKKNDNYVIVSVEGDCTLRFFNDRRDDQIEEVKGECFHELTYRKHNGEWKLYDLELNLPEVNIQTYWEDDEDEDYDSYENTEDTEDDDISEEEE